MEQNLNLKAGAIASAVYILSKDVLKEREADIVFRILKGENLKQIGRDYGIGDDRVRQIAKKSFHFLKEKVESYQSVKEKYEVLKKQYDLLEMLYKCLQDVAINKLSNGLVKSPQKEIPAVLTQRITDCGFSVRCMNCLKGASIEYVYELAAKKRVDLLKFRNFGKKSLVEIDDFFKENGIEFGTDLSIYILPCNE